MSFKPEDLRYADPFELFMARLLGTRVELEEDGHVLVVYRYKDRLYVSAFYPSDPDKLI